MEFFFVRQKRIMNCHFGNVLLFQDLKKGTLDFCLRFLNSNSFCFDIKEKEILFEVLKHPQNGIYCICVSLSH